jgi:hypothetical protein
MDKLVAAIFPFVDGKSTKLALSALIIDSILALVLALIIGGGVLGKDTITFLIHPPIAYFIGGIYLSFFFVIWFLLYIQTMRENDDGFSEVREKLVGTWIVTYTSVSLKSLGFSSPTRFTVGCSISINPDTRKLEFRFNTKDNPVYADEIHTVSIVALRRDFERTYNLFYYYEGDQKLQQKFSERILREDGTINDKIEIEYLGIVKFDLKQNMVRVQEMKGNWYDLNGNIARVNEMLNELNDLTAKEAELPKMRLSDMEVATVGARLGEVEFTRGA